jgi:hypothetical protein
MLLTVTGDMLKDPVALRLKEDKKDKNKRQVQRKTTCRFIAYPYLNERKGFLSAARKEDVHCSYSTFFFCLISRC